MEYSQQRELNEYLEYVQFLQTDGLLTDAVEHLELEDTQGITGLKAIRLTVNLDAAEKEPPRLELSKVTSRELVSK